MHVSFMSQITIEKEINLTADNYSNPTTDDSLNDIKNVSSLQHLPKTSNPLKKQSVRIIMKSGREEKTFPI